VIRPVFDGQAQPEPNRPLPSFSCSSSRGNPRRPRETKDEHEGEEEILREFVRLPLLIFIDSWAPLSQLRFPWKPMKCAGYLISVKAHHPANRHADRVMANNDVTLDAREEIAHGRQPCGKIFQIIASLKPRQGLRLLAPFEPVPLFERLSDCGFGYHARELANGDWEVRFAREITENQVERLAATPASPSHSCGCHEPAVVDARGLEPPGPMVRVLEALEQLPPGQSLRALTDRPPLHLYPMLEERGFTGQTERRADGAFQTIIRATR
jgi:uncharacterized protein (DUF2249 family)